MTTPRETELKYLLETEDDYRALLSLPELRPHGGPVEQHNVYFDTEGRRLLSCGAMLRLRTTDRRILTFKEGRESEEIAGFFDAIEVECALEADVADRILESPEALHALPVPPVEMLHERFGEVPLRRLASLHNERRFLAGRYPLEVDRMTFADGSQAWEVEIETDDPGGARDWLEDLARRAGIRASPRRRTKLALVMERAVE